MISISMKNVGKSFGTNTVLNDVTLEAYGGEILGLLGPSGAGKTTIINMQPGCAAPQGYDYRAGYAQRYLRKI